ncbi:Na+/H+ antiporter, partial [Morganella morganii]
AGVRGAITLAGVLSIPLFLPDGTPFPARYQMVFIAAGVIIFSLFMGVVSLPFLLKGMHVGDKQADANEIRAAKAAMAEVAIVSIGKMEERLSASSDEALDAEAISEVASRVAGHLRRRTAGDDEMEYNLQVEDLERRFRLTALRAERGELYHQRATRNISNETLQLLLHDLDLLEALLVEKET